MSDVEKLEARIEEALERLKGSLSGGAISADSADASRMDELQAENERLTAGLEAFRSQRDQDVAQLDKLISQLKPLVEEVT